MGLWLSGYQMTYDPEDDMCPNCVTPWKCNGPHLTGEEGIMEILITMSDGKEFLINESGYMFLKQGSDIIDLGKESVATLEKFVSELNRIKRYLTEE